MVSVYLDEASWRKVLAGFDIVDIAIRTSTLIQLVAKKAVGQDGGSMLLNEHIPSRLITLIADRPDGVKYGFQELEGMRYPKAGVSRAPFPKPCGLIASRGRNGLVWPLGGGSGPMEEIAPGRVMGTERLKCINGFTYAVGVGRSVYKRIEAGRWIQLADGFPVDEVTTEQGFSDIDAFSDSDIYAVGGKGDVWHFNGMTWSQMGFPSNVELGTVTCAGDGNVYISGEGGSLWVGGKSTWKQIYRGTSSILWNDVLWFQNKLWLSSDYEFRQWSGKNPVPVEHNGAPVLISGHMDAYDGVLAVASPSEVLLFDGNTWRTLVAPYAQ